MHYLIYFIQEKKKKRMNKNNYHILQKILNDMDDLSMSIPNLINLKLKIFLMGQILDRHHKFHQI